MVLDIDTTDANACVDRIEELEKALLECQKMFSELIKTVSRPNKDNRDIQHYYFLCKHALEKKDGGPEVK